MQSCFSLDEKTAIQALDRRDPVLPLSPGRAERNGFEYIRRGTLSLYAALNTRTGEVLGQTAPHHTSASRPTIAPQSRSSGSTPTSAAGRTLNIHPVQATTADVGFWSA